MIPYLSELGSIAESNPEKAEKKKALLQLAQIPSSRKEKNGRVLFCFVELSGYA